jgi:hypothetical protein
MSDQAPFKFKTLKPQRKWVDLDDGRRLELRSPDDDSTSEFQAAIPDGKDDEKFNLNAPQRRGMVRALVGACLFNGDGKPLGAEFVKQTFQKADINEMFLWLIDAAGMRNDSEEAVKN